MRHKILVFENIYKLEPSPNICDDDDYSCNSSIAAPIIPVSSSSGSFSHMDSIARKIESEKKSAPLELVISEIKTDKQTSKFLKFLKNIYIFLR